ncbi:MAG: diguanylate cyclase [Tahibacter sp.]
MQRAIQEGPISPAACSMETLAAVNGELVTASLDAQTAADECHDELAQISQSVGRDGLTGMHNRKSFRSRFVQAKVIAKRHGTRMALLFLDFNNFKQINDSFGHTCGDQALKHAADCLAACVRESDTVSRHGGDEFVILLTDISQADDAVVFAHKIVDALAAPFCIGEHSLSLMVSIGISQYPDDGNDLETLIAHADTAMYCAKREGVTHIVFEHHPAVSGRASAASALLNLFSRAPQPLSATSQAHLRDTNEALVLSAISAQEQLATTALAHRKNQEFVAVAVHELRNPLTPIRVAAALLGQTHIDQLPRMKKAIERQVGHLTRLISDLMDVSRANTGKLRLVLGDIKLADTIDDAVAATRPAMELRHQQFHLQLPSLPISIRADAVRVAQIVSNLLDNASRYTPPEGQIGLSVVMSHEDAVLTVTDNGIGISADALPRVFEPFEQDVRAVGFSREGLGIGLTVVRELAHAHGGTVVVSSAGEGLGSTFVVRLPLDGPSFAAQTSQG